ncbi:Pathogenesis-related transcriptional factor and ERF protein [Neolewinella aurantiaca]|uniref:Pathogenesis-related transcriptional factor and ERF protein n=1 Tax=Neolewinella aurantiaca TaxID=2602767 RepID=A0A5C7FLF4_9BACT|nr:Pathogenesis-related transcriptional factor and ERF protein [Neolewinella aurantiaca]TXF91537.1 Pathogenesis-related transcriptional factor and ERF protein [Neolewinella aurantiaca]
MRKLSLKNDQGVVLIDDTVFEELSHDPHLSAVDFFSNLRKHSSGCVVFQKTYKKQGEEKGYRTETIYLHKLIAERYLSDQRVGNKNLVGTVNGNKLDCRLANLEYRTRAVASRKRKSSSKAGYTGVYRENNRFRAVISKDRRSIHIGMYATAEEAALAYNKKSLELFGSEGKLNVIPSSPGEENTPRGDSPTRKTKDSKQSDSGARER